MLSSCENNTGQNQGKKMPNKSFESVVRFMYFGMMIMSQNCIVEDIKSRLTMGNACNHFHPEYGILLFSLLYQNINVRIHRPLILPGNLCGCKA